MVSVAQVQNGIGRYISEEFVGKLTGARKWIVDAGAAMILSNGAAAFEKLKGSTFVQMMGVIDENNNVDIEKAYRHFKAAAAKGPVTFDMPLLGAVTLNEGDVDKIYRLIVGG